MSGLRGKRCVVTGASAGLGTAFARELARRGADLVITARRGELLESLAAELREQHGVEVTCVALDLASPPSRAELVTAAYAGGEVDLVVNNAGFGDYQPFEDIPWERHAALLALNVDAVVELTHRFSARMLARADGARCHIANVTSVLSWFAVPRFAVYAASRSFVRSFTEAAAAELASSNLRLTCVAFGGTRTEFNQVAGIQPGRLYRLVLGRPEPSARKAVRAVLRGRRVVVVGWMNRLAAWTTRLVPRRMAGWLMGGLLGPPRAALPPAPSDRPVE